jgi:hypothetical protein
VPAPILTQRPHPLPPLGARAFRESGVLPPGAHHVIIFNERHLRRVLSSYFQYHHDIRTHLSLGKDCPRPRPIQSPSAGNIIAFPEVGGLHHRYERRAA